MPLSDLVDHWELDEASGNAISGTGSNDLTDVNGVGTSGGARDFEAASSQALTRADNAALSFGNEGLTIAAFVTAESLPASLDMSIVQKTTGSGGDYFLQIRSSDLANSRFAFIVYGSASFGNEGKVLADTFGEPFTATLYFVLGWHDPVNDVVGIQINDGTADTTAHTAGIVDGTGDFEVSGVTFSNFWDGTIKKLSIFRGVLSAAEKTWLYNSGSGRTYSEILAGMGGEPATADGKILIAPVGFA